MAIKIKSMLVEYDEEDAREAAAMVSADRVPYLNLPNRNDYEVKSVQVTKDGRLLVNLRRRKEEVNDG